MFSGGFVKKGVKKEKRGHVYFTMKYSFSIFSIKEAPLIKRGFQSPVRHRIIMPLNTWHRKPHSVFYS